MIKAIYEEIVDLRNRISMDGEDVIYQEDYLVLDRVLDFLEYELETSTILGRLEKKIREIYQFDNEFKRLLLETQQFLLGERDKHDEMTEPHGRFEFLVDLINEIIY